MCDMPFQLMTGMIEIAIAATAGRIISAISAVVAHVTVFLSAVSHVGLLNASPVVSVASESGSLFPRQPSESLITVTLVSFSS